MFKQGFIVTYTGRVQSGRDFGYPTDETDLVESNEGLLRFEGYEDLKVFPVKIGDELSSQEVDRLLDKAENNLKDERTREEIKRDTLEFERLKKKLGR